MKGLLLFLGGAAAGAAGLAWYTSKKLTGWNPFAGALGAGEGISLPNNSEMVATCIRQLRRYAFAASQDKSPIVGLTHASYALVLLDTAEEVLGRDAIARAGYDTKKIRTFIVRNQDKHAEALKRCDPFLQEVLALERADPRGALPGFVLADPWAAPRGA